MEYIEKECLVIVRRYCVDLWRSIYWRFIENTEL